MDSQEFPSSTLSSILDFGYRGLNAALYYPYILEILKSKELFQSSLLSVLPLVG